MVVSLIIFSLYFYYSDDVLKEYLKEVGLYRFIGGLAVVIFILNYSLQILKNQGNIAKANDLLYGTITIDSECNFISLWHAYCHFKETPGIKITAIEGLEKIGESFYSKLL